MEEKCNTVTFVTTELFGRIIKLLIKGECLKKESLTATTVTMGLLGSVVLQLVQVST